MDGKSAQMEACGQLGHFGIRSLDLDPSLLRPEGNLSVPVAPSPTSSEPRRREYESMPRSDLPPTLQRECQQLRIIFTLKWTLRLQAKMLASKKSRGYNVFQGVHSGNCAKFLAHRLPERLHVEGAFHKNLTQQLRFF